MEGKSVYQWYFSDGEEFFYCRDFLSYQLNEPESKNITGFIKIASPAFVELVSVKTGGQACSIFRKDLTTAEQILF